MPSPFVRVAVPSPLEDLFTYAVPPPLQATISPGHAVLAPFGHSLVTGWVVEPLEEPDIPLEKIRSIERILDPVPVVDPAQMAFLKWAARYYLAPLGEMLQTALPSASRARTRRVLLPEGDAAGALAEGSVPEPRATVLREIVRRPGSPVTALKRNLASEVEKADVDRAIEALRRAGLVRGVLQEVGAGRDRVKVVHLRIDPLDLARLVPRAGSRMREVVSRLAEAGGHMDLPALTEAEGENAAPVVKRLTELGILEIRTEEPRDPITEGDTGNAPVSPLPPTGPQALAIQTLAEHSGYGVFLLHGVTGSGKTEVYLQMAQQVLARDRQVLVLLPEIGLTPQTVGRFRARFGDAVAVLHSGLSAADRLQQWRRVRASRARVAVGARSALFAPFRHLGLVIVDEEHDDSYKQDDGVRYHARDLAVVRGRMADCPVVLGSATPSLESLHNVQTGRYRLLSLPERATSRPVPQVEVVDLNREPRDEEGQVPLLTARLREVLGETLSARGKAILLYNRRGYANVVQCDTCASSFTCPSCGVSLVLHKKVGSLMCHWCGLKMRLPDRCPACTGELVPVGRGSERVEEAVSQAFPGVPVGRMDADTTASRGAHQRILDAFRRGEVQLLVGTQLVAKGHDFPDVHAAAVVGLDHVLSLPDFRAAERAFALVIQLAGRAGRGETPGRVILQTHHPDHFVFQSLSNPTGFVEREMKVRRVLGYPPFTRLVMIRFEGVDAAQTRSVADDLARRLRADRPPGRVVDVLGPTPAPMARLVGRWRFQVVLRAWQVPPFRTWLEERRSWFRDPSHRGVRVTVDVDPRSLL